MVEHYLDTVGVTGSNPVSRTITSRSYTRVLREFAEQLWADCSNFTVAKMRLRLIARSHRKTRNVIRNIEDKEEALVFRIRPSEMRFDEVGLFVSQLSVEA